MRTFGEAELALRMTYPGFVFRTLTKEGHAPATLLAGTGLTEASLADPAFRAELPPLRRLFLNAIAESGEPHLGIRIAGRFEAGFIGLPAYAAMNAATFEAALSVLSRFLVLAFPAIEFTAPDVDADARPGEFAIRLRPQVPLGDIAYFATVSALIGFERICRDILRIPSVALRGELGVGKPAGWAQAEAQVGFPVHFDAPAVRLFLPARLLPTTLPGADPLNHRILLTLCEDAAARSRVEPTLIGRVVALIEREQHFALPISHVARTLGYSERGLRRHLQSAGTSYRALTNRIRERRARDLLAGSAKPISTIAHELGFDTPSNFTRSFKLWAGISPSAFRLAHSTARVPVETE